MIVTPTFAAPLDAKPDLTLLTSDAGFDFLTRVIFVGTARMNPQVYRVLF
jgi:hypothetical protein